MEGAGCSTVGLKDLVQDIGESKPGVRSHKFIKLTEWRMN